MNDKSKHASHIGRVVRRRRKSKKLTLTDLANMITDYDAGNLSRFERGGQGIADDKLAEIAAALEVSVSALYAEAEGVNSETEAKTIKSLAESLGESILTSPPEIQQIIQALLFRYEADNSSGAEIARAIKTLLGVR